jgi:hypothetical protein
MSGKAFIQAKIYWAPLSYVQITSVSAAVGLSPPSDATIAEITVEAQAIRYRDDGTNPTATVGMPVAAGNSFQYAGDLSTIKFIEQTAGAILNISYYK